MEGRLCDDRTHISVIDSVTDAAQPLRERQSVAVVRALPRHAAKKKSARIEPNTDRGFTDGRSANRPREFCNAKKNPIHWRRKIQFIGD
jgi:hypothetical protein